MSFLLSTADFLQPEHCAGRLHLQMSETEGVVLSRKVQGPYKASGSATRLSLSGPPKFPFSFFPSFKHPEASGDPSSVHRKPRRHSDSIFHREPAKWRSEPGVEDLLGKLALGKTASRRGSALGRITEDDSPSGDESDRDSSALSLSDTEKTPDQPTISDWETVSFYKTTPNRCSGSGRSSGGSHHSNRSSSSGQNQQTYHGSRSGGGGGPSGGNNGSPPSLPRPLDPPVSDGKKYYACWFWLSDPVRYHACADIRKEAHHLKHIHLPHHYPDGLPVELGRRMSYDSVWQVLFPGRALPSIKDRDQQLLLMAQIYQRFVDEETPVPSTPQQNIGLLSPNSIRYQSEAGESSRHAPPSVSQPASHHPSFDRRRVSSHSRQTRRLPHSIVSAGFTNWESSSNASSRLAVDLGGYDGYYFPSSNVPQRLDEPARMLPDNEGILNPVEMDIASDHGAEMSSHESMEIDIMQRAPAPFYPSNPRIKVQDWTTGEEYFWEDRHPDTLFDFSRYFLVYYGDRSTGANCLISMRSMDCLQKEYYYYLKPMASSDGYIILQRQRGQNYSAFPG
ncbi:hypothetical protein H072_8112 [Dactylellina haptotyla CBS 200.50]|uniref:Uncharacterized protein n=1 Tax=Dactylellina haptotyla (strain CBS 200.50) TaxID=1284197 RepID=S8A5G9_DACHA|nr:hypothetical protein H072_8112 [Dactylellina haptotyla CBS 200.50]